MEYKLKSGSSISITNASDTEICSVAEDGTVSGFGGGTQWYIHTIEHSTGRLTILTTVATITQQTLYDYVNSFGYASRTLTINNVVHPFIIIGLYAGTKDRDPNKIYINVSSSKQYLIGDYCKLIAVNSAEYGKHLALEGHVGTFTVDGSTLTYNAGSTISYSAWFYGDMTITTTTL